MLVNRGFDGRSVIIGPEVKDNHTTGILLLQVKFHERLPAAVIRGVLTGYRNRYSAIRDHVTETEPTFREDLLGTMNAVDLLVSPVAELAESWRSPKS